MAAQPDYLDNRPQPSLQDKHYRQPPSAFAAEVSLRCRTTAAQPNNLKEVTVKKDHVVTEQDHMPRDVPGGRAGERGQQIESPLL